MSARVVFVVGTGTDVGKTHVSSCLVLRAHGSLRAAAYKPIATGLGPPRHDGSQRVGEDARRLADIVQRAAEPPCFGYAAPLSPHLAARLEGASIELDPVVRSIDRVLDEPLDVLVVESAGGLFTPLNDRETNADLARMLAARFERHLALLLVAPDRIGVLHDVGATLRAARSEGLMLPVLALSAPAEADESTGSNADEVIRLRLASYVISFPRSAPSSLASLAAAAQCLGALGIHGG